MGSFGGHALPGSFFVIFALWWVIQMFNRYYSTRQKNNRFTSSATFKCQCLCGQLKNLPLEAFIKLFFVSVGFGLEIYTAFDNGKFFHIGNGQHATMFFYFGLTGIMDILIHYKAPLPPDMDYISMVFALLCEFVLFRFHLHGRTDLDVLLHTLLLYAIAGSILSVILEMRYRNNILCSLARPYFILLQGTWFWQVGWILYPPFQSSFHWNEEDHEQMMIATMIFAWHAAGSILVILVIGGVIAYIHRRFVSYRRGDDMALKSLVNNGETVIRLGDDSDSDL